MPTKKANQSENPEQAVDATMLMGQAICADLTLLKMTAKQRTLLLVAVIDLQKKYAALQLSEDVAAYQQLIESAYGLLAQFVAAEQREQLEELELDAVIAALHYLLHESLKKKA
jgi:hypothetical protein